VDYPLKEGDRIMKAMIGSGPVFSAPEGGSSAGVHGASPAIWDEILPDDIQWIPFAAFPESARLAVLVGDLAKPGPYVVRVKLPHDVKLMPHMHPEDRIYTVISGVFYIGRGTTFDPEKLRAYPPGSLVILPGNTPHFHWAKSGEYVTQVSGFGPLGIDYVDTKDDPRGH
jgi:quercetin dioxygenase-like cupin family protein